MNLIGTAPNQVPLNQYLGTAAFHEISNIVLITGNQTVAGNKTLTGVTSVGNLRIDTNTVSSTNTNGTISIQTNGTGEVVVNNSGNASNFRVSGDTNVNLLFTNGATDRVGINSSSPQYKLHVETSSQGVDGLAIYNSTNNLVIRPNSSAGNSNPLVQAQDKAIIYSNGTAETGNLVIAPWSTSSFGIRMTNAGNVGINVSPNSSFALDINGAIRNNSGNVLLSTSARADAQVEIGSSRATGSGTWAASASTTVTITSNGHGYATGNRVDLVFTMATGTNATSGNYVVTVTDVNTFTIVNPASITGTGTVTIGSAGAAYIDLITDTTNTDYGFRIFRGNTGANSATQLTNRGSGSLTLQTESTGPIVINTNATTRAIFDGNSHVVTFGNAGTSATPTASTIVGATGGSGTDISATQLILRGGLSTGSATGGSISFQTGTVGSTGTTAQTATERLRIDTSAASTILDLVTPATTANVLNANATTLNLAGAATTVNLGHVGTTARTVNIATAATGGASTMTFGGAITGNIFKIAGTAAGTTNYTSDVTTGTINLFAGTTTGTVNIGSAAAGKLAVAFNTTATSISTGALTVTGGVGITENLWVGGYINIDNLRFETNTLSSTNTDGNIILAPNGLGFAAVGTSTPTRKLHVQSTTATTNAVTQVLRLDSQSSATPAVGIGSGLEFAIETSANNTEVGATIEAITTAVGAGTEEIDLVFRAMTVGAAASEKMRIRSTGGITETLGGIQYALVSQFDIGTAPNDIPLNQYLGSLAFQSYVSGGVF